MSFDRSLARCSFCGRRPPEVRRMVAGPGAAYICDQCLALCQEIINDQAPFSPKALELASRPPVVIAAPQEMPQNDAEPRESREPLRTRTIELEQRLPGGTLMLRQLEFYQQHFELHYLWMRAPFTRGFAFVPRLIFLLRDSTGFEWTGDRGGLLFERSELSSDPDAAVYQGSARFRPLPSDEARHLIVRAADPLGLFESPPLHPWGFEISL